MKEKIIKTLFVLSIVCVCINLDAQTVIREKVKIKPTKKSMTLLSQRSTKSAGVGFSVSWSDTFATGFLLGEDVESFTGWLQGITSYSSSLEPHATGAYGFQIRKMGSSSVNYTFYCGEVILAQGAELVLKDGDCCPAYANISCGYIEANDFVFWTIRGSLCNSRTSTTIYPSMEFNYDPSIDAPINSVTKTFITLTKNNSDVELFNSRGESLGQSAQVLFKDLGQIGIRLLSPYDGEEADTVKINIVADGISRDNNLIVEGKGTFYIGGSILDNYEFLHGAHTRIDLTASSANYCRKENLPPSTKYNVEIVKGIQYGRIVVGNSSMLDTSFYNIDHDNGQARIEYSADGVLPTITDTITIRLSTTDSKIEPAYIQLIIHPQKIKVNFEPSMLAVGDTAKIILKKIKDDGTQEDFSPDQWFEYNVTEGLGYGTFYIPDWRGTTSSFTGLPQQIKFVATNGKVDTTVYSKILVKTTAGWVSKVVPSKSSLPVAGNHLKSSSRIMKITSTKDDNEQLWGEGTVAIGKAKADTFYVRASFDKPNFVAGDLLTVNFVKIDKNGNESNFPEGTLFEARVDEGCTVGSIVGSSNGSYIKDVLMPIKFQVNSTLSPGDTLIVIKVGVPGNDGNRYLSYKTLRDKNNTATLNLKMNNKLMNLTGITSACGAGGFDNSVNADAVAKGDGDCRSADKCTDKMEVPKLNFTEQQTNHKTPCSMDETILGNFDWERNNEYWSSRGYEAVFPK